MAITIMHIRTDIDPEHIARISLPVEDEQERAQRALKLLQDGAYEAVAEVDSENLEEAYYLTQNGIASDSWSRFPPEKVRPLGQTSFEINGRSYGRKTTAVGDVFIKDDEAFVVASFGFEKIEGWEPEPSSPTM